MSCPLPECEFSVYDEDALDMAIFISPQYKDDKDILNAIYNYADAVYNDISWNVDIIGIDNTNNNYTDISDIIYALNDNNPLKACMVVGEDTDIAISTAEPNKMIPCTAPWYLVGGSDTYTVDKNGHIVDEPVHVNIPTSILYPNYNDSFTTKKNQIIFTFNKFSVDRNIDYSNDILFLHDAAFNCLQYQSNPPEIGDVTCVDNPTTTDIKQGINTKYKMLCINGHGTVGKINLKNSYFYAEKHANIANTPFMAFSACWSHGWCTDKNTTTVYSPPYKDDYMCQHEWFGHSILVNPNLRVITSGTTTGYVLLRLDEKLSLGLTIAEAMKDTIISTGWNVVYGDPTFHY